MTYDLVAATRDDVDPTMLLLALDEANPTGPRLTLRPDPHDRVLTVADPDGRDLLWIGPTRPVARPAAQAHRLGLDTLTDADIHWTDVCTRHLQHLSLARAVAERLVAHAGGRVADLTGGAQPDNALPLPPDVVDPPAPFDAVGSTECVLVQRRPVVALGAWLTHAMMAANTTHRALVVITPPATTLTPAVDRLVHHRALRWVVDDGVSSFEPHRQARVDWDGARFVDLVDPDAAAPTPPDPAGPPDAGPPASDAASPTPAVAFPSPASVDSGWALHCETEVLHPYDKAPAGRMANAVAFALGLADPLDAGLMEPAEAAWDPGLVAELARKASPVAARVVVGGEHLDGTLSVIPQPGGVLERLELLTDAGASPRTEPELRTLGERLLDAGIDLAIIGYRRSGGARLMSVVTATTPVVPALLVAHPRRFPGLTADQFDAAVATAGDHPLVLTFPAPQGLSPQDSAATVRRWHAALALLRQHDTLADRPI
ncbi:MAG: DUF6177 family protein [Dermatophilaceae bacterium]